MRNTIRRVQDHTFSKWTQRRGTQLRVESGKVGKGVRVDAPTTIDVQKGDFKVGVGGNVLARADATGVSTSGWPNDRCSGIDGEAELSTSDAVRR
jgi:hypothetical protein